MSIFDHTPDTLQAWCTSADRPKFLAKQLLDWVYQKGVINVDEMTNISKANRAWLRDAMTWTTGSILKHQIASDGTQKLLVGWPEPGSPSTLPVLQAGSGRETECVMIPAPERKTACISSQVGCPVGCRFCASGIGGLDGNLRRGQIVEQVFHLQACPDIDRITNIVFMGMGEPLSNFNAVTHAIRTLNAPWGFGISARKITVSTVGLPGAIRKLVDFEIPVTLALSLHAPNDEIRRSLIPWAEYATIDELFDACDAYYMSTGREITLEYLLIRRVNDRPEHAAELAEIARRLRANINLIRYNEVDGMPYERPTDDDVRAFQRVLRERRRNVHIRASRGRDIAAACGQLRHERRAESSSRSTSTSD
ncbi:MAG: 23S rRNA (adenine(2503)-C(2))-methyltransferase RlmN [Planctomycetota bacterium]